MTFSDWIKSGSPWIWLTGSAVSTSLILVFGMLLLILSNGLGHFWPKSIVQTTWQSPQGEQLIYGVLNRDETLSAARLAEAGIMLPEGQEFETRYLFKVGNRDVFGVDFRWLIGNELGEFQFPADAALVERREWGDAIGVIQGLRQNGRSIAQGDSSYQMIEQRLQDVQQLHETLVEVQKKDIGSINYRLERLRLKERKYELDNALTASRQAELAEQRAALQEEYVELEKKMQQIAQQMEQGEVELELSDGTSHAIPLKEIVRIYHPNSMNIVNKFSFYLDKFLEFLTEDPREANTEGGIFPAIFGTVLMVMIMSILVTPFGVLAAIYLREYAKQGVFVRTIRIAVNNLAGVPSIVYGVFGLGFFVYFLGGSIDEIFFPAALPAPTLGTPGLLWSSLTLALLTVPVVIVSTEEALSRIPQALREGSYALGATQAETMRKVIVPMSMPGIMTGLILAIARAAGEVAPLMLVGVVKLAPALPFDGNFPYLHLDRKFMHLGFHIYDVGFQSPNVEAARPLVYATAFLLVAIIAVLNLTAIMLRNRLREKYQT
ncbi:MAG TPA: phosphate ABC transporter permease PtsA [Gammaproteobacteria bacterium]|nr:phosphate ABC transporter permease PtsA [Gammaproteobacteria bacterium]